MRSNSYWTILPLSLALVAGTAILPGCGEKKPPPKPVAPPPPPPPPAPKQIDVGTLLQTSKADKRVQFPQEKAPVDDTVALAVINLASAIAKGDSKAMGGMMINVGKDVLDQLVASGQWDESTSKIEAVRVVELIAPTAKPESFNVSFAVQEPGVAYLVRFIGTLDNGRYVFTGMPGGRKTHARANQFDDGIFD
ncbi:MAG: hypothetical protein JNM86_03045 [Phycisphaerae bacterium]|nr:hypothetical protein [Phycisphaerae bacterium]MBN8596092.1 hypothetical protein [Planctomycetota bacterium]